MLRGAARFSKRHPVATCINALEVSPILSQKNRMICTLSLINMKDECYAFKDLKIKNLKIYLHYKSILKKRLSGKVKSRKKSLL